MYECVLAIKHGLNLVQKLINNNKYKVLMFSCSSDLPIAEVCISVEIIKNQ